MGESRRGDHEKAGRQPRRGGSGAAVRVLWGLVALIGLTGLGIFVRAHALGPGIAAAMAGAAVLAFVAGRPAWLLLLFGLLPVVDLAAWTGQIYLTESDGLVFAAVSVFALRRALGGAGVRAESQPAMRFGPVQYLLVGLVLASYLISTQWSVLLAAGTEPGLLVGYSSPLNGPRIAKGFLLALLVLPVLLALMREEPAKAPVRFGYAMLSSLCAVSLAALWERLAFTGLTDFASDYRTTAMFWEMNVGGAQLDAWIALTLPFLWWALAREHGRWRLGALAVLAVLAVYACFTTFSRGLYAGALAGLVVCGLGLARPAMARLGWKTALLGGALAAIALAVLGALLASVFQTGGYRGLAAMLGVLMVALLAVHRVARASLGTVVLAILAGGGLGVATLLLSASIAKGPYIVHGLVTMAMLVFLSLARPGGLSPRAAALVATGGLVWCAFNAGVVSVHWGGTKSFVPAVAAATGIVLMTVLLRLRAQAIPAPGLRAVVAGGACFAGVGLIAVAMNTYFAATRFSQVEGDFEGRMAHWRIGADLPTADERLFGIGTGHYAERYFWNAPRALTPGSHSLLSDGPRAFMRLGGPRHVIGFGELYRLTQHVDSHLVLPLTLTLSVRAPQGFTMVYAEVCRKYLLYPDGCIFGRAEVPTDGKWATVSLTLPGKGQQLGGLGVWMTRTTTFSIANEGRGSVLDVGGAELVDASGRALLRNGDFSGGQDFWFFSSDRHHLPWHAKNLWLHYFVEQGWFGVLAFSVLLLAALFRVSVGGAARHELSAPLAGAIVAVSMVGAFDSIVDAPRLLLMLFSLLFVALGLRSPSAIAGGQGSGGRQA